MILKNRIHDLVVFGGAACIDAPLFVGRPVLPDRKLFLSLVNEILDNRRFTNNGPMVREFEQRLCRFLDVENCIAVCNATTGIQIAMRALGITGEVILPSFTFVATAQALSWVGIKPVFCDIAAETHNIDSGLIETLITPRTSAILGVHLWGRPCEISALQRIADRNRIRLVFDAAHAIGASYQGRMLGGFGDAEIFSFHATKILGTFEGGLITTRSDALAEKLRAMRNFGFGESGEADMLGTNGKMAEINAAMGILSLDEIAGRISINKRNHHRFASGLSGIPGIRLIAYDSAEQANYQYVVVEITEDELGCSAEQLQKFLESENIYAKRYFHPGCHRMPCYAALEPSLSGLEITENLGSRVLVLPNDSALQLEEIDQICRLILLLSGYSRESRMPIPGTFHVARVNA